MIKAVQLFAVVLCLGTDVSSAIPGSEFYVGSWSAGGEAAISIIGDIQISASYIEWFGSRSSPSCRSTYKVAKRTSGRIKYPDEGWLKSELANHYPYETVKIRLGKADCLGETAYMRFAMRADDAAYLDVVPYDSSNKPAGSFGFYKLDRFVCAGRPVEVVHSVRKLPEEVQALLGRGRTSIDGIVDSDAKLNNMDPNLPMRRFNWAAVNSDCIFAIVERGGSQDPFEVDDFRRAPQQWISGGRRFSRTAPTLDDVMRGVK